MMEPGVFLLFLTEVTSTVEQEVGRDLELREVVEVQFESAGWIESYNFRGFPGFGIRVYEFEFGQLRTSR